MLRRFVVSCNLVCPKQFTVNSNSKLKFVRNFSKIVKSLGNDDTKDDRDKVIPPTSQTLEIPVAFPTEKWSWIPPRKFASSSSSSSTNEEESDENNEDKDMIPVIDGYRTSTFLYIL